jgi:hypothetical protein
MRIFKFLLLTVVIFSLFGCASAQTNKRRTNKKSESKNTNSMNDKLCRREIKNIAEGSYGAVETPFIYVARSKETYAHLQSFIENLPPATEIDFSRASVVAAFAGTKNTGGYSVTIRNANGKISVEVVEPPKDAITTDALTMPFLVSLVPVEKEKSLPLEVSANWKSAMQTYKVASGKFESSGGLAGRLKKFDAEGTIGVMRFGDYVTLAFNLSGKGADKNMKLTEMASGMAKDGAIDLARLDAGSFSAGPKAPLKVSGTISNDKLSVRFEPLPVNIPDGFQVGGKIDAVKIK